MHNSRSSSSTHTVSPIIAKLVCKISAVNENGTRTYKAKMKSSARGTMFRRNDCSVCSVSRRWYFFFFRRRFANWGGEARREGVCAVRRCDNNRWRKRRRPAEADSTRDRARRTKAHSAPTIGDTCDDLGRSRCRPDLSDHRRLASRRPPSSSNTWRTRRTDSM